MADTLIKTVRVRKNAAAQVSSIEGYGAFDLKISIYISGLLSNKRKITVTDNKGNPIPGKDPQEYSTTGRYSGFTDNEFIRDYIDTLAKLQPPNKSTITTPDGEKPVYEVIQDPWQDNAPLVRNYGNDPYHMNDGSIITIKWFRKSSGNKVSEGGREWSDPKASKPWELELDKISRNGVEITLDSKKVYIKTPTGKNLAVAWKSGVSPRELTSKNVNIILQSDLKPQDEVEFPGTDKDTKILARIAEIWQLQLNDTTYSFKKCNPDYDSCELDSNQKIEFKDPTQTLPKEESKKDEQKSDESVKSKDGSKTNASGTKVKLVAKIPDDFNAQANKDFPKFKIFIGDVPASDTIYRPIENDGYSDSEEDQLGEEFTEAAFASEEEKLTVLLNEVTDNPTGLNEEAKEQESTSTTSTPTTTTSAPVSVASSAPGPGPSAGSKLLYKSSYKGTTNYYLFDASKGLAGHRLKNVITDLQNYLNANGYPGTKLGNNGIMRDLLASTYPSSPARAKASLHGAGLAIDLTFSIPGFSWKGIGDNGNLAKDANLTKKIMAWVKSQGDLTWGAQWGKGSNPGAGIVLDRGIVEYHHFEIKSDKIIPYWEPFKDEITRLGIDYKKLNTSGKGSALLALNEKLLAQVGVIS